jgi:hypothetical protein
MDTHSARFRMAGRILEVETNFELALDFLQSGFPRPVAASGSADFLLRARVEGKSRTGTRWTVPSMRGVNHLVYAGFDADNSLLIDLRRRLAISRFSAAFAADRDFWLRMIVPLVLGVAGASLGITALHCACVLKDSHGLILSGPSGAGKSTLAWALARHGFEFLSDEWTYFSSHEGKLRAWGLPAPLKLLPDAAVFFPELETMRVGTALNGERAYQFDPTDMPGVRRVESCEPRWLIFLERDRNSNLSLGEISPQEAMVRLEEGLLAEEPSAAESQRTTLRALVGERCALLRHGSSPEAVREALEQFCAQA